jgi:hypothetical protein
MVTLDKYGDDAEHDRQAASIRRPHSGGSGPVVVLDAGTREGAP